MIVCDRCGENANQQRFSSWEAGVVRGVLSPRDLNEYKRYDLCDACTLVVAEAAVTAALAEFSPYLPHSSSGLPG